LRFFSRRYSNILFTTPVSEGKRLEKVLGEQPHLETDPFVAYGEGQTCDVLVDVKSEHEAGIIKVGTNVVKYDEKGNVVGRTTYIANSYQAFLPTRKAKALKSTWTFILATYFSIVGADSGIAIWINGWTLLTNYETFVPVLLKALFLAIGPTAVAYFLRKLGQDK
jgi:hypothetical protein